MNHVATLYVGNPYSEHSLRAVSGKGATEIEAIENCLEKVRQRIELDVEIAEGVVLPPKVASTAPSALPDGSGLLIFVRCSHSDGGPYDWRFFALNYGTHSLYSPRFAEYDSDYEKCEKEFTIGEKPVVHSFLDCNADYEFRLPVGSKEFVDGAWVPCEVAGYNY